MREIKFRAFDQTKKEMFYTLHPVWNSDFFGRLEADPDNYSEIMQYTGLKDKNGKEIYEGDILQIVGSYKEYVEIRWRGEESRYDCWDCDWDNNGENSDWHENLVGLSESNAKELEVVGNIYEKAKD